MLVIGSILLPACCFILMSDLSQISRDQLQSRRQTLRRQRRRLIVQVLWRFWALSGLTTAIFWGTTRPIWLIQDPGQINVRGNALLSDKTIQDLVPLDYPQPLLKVEPEQLAEQLQNRAPLVSAEVSRQLLPPRLNIQVQERQPVAVVLPVSETSLEAKGIDFLPAGLIDAEGAWMPKSGFLLSNSTMDLPALRLRGLQSQYRRYWPQVYAALAQSPVKIHEIDWRDPSNLVLQTELGIVYLGPFTPELEQQLATLDKMRNLPEQLEDTEVAHIDLTNPSIPSISVVNDGKTPHGEAQEEEVQ
jgi:cell division protein FtsQ